MLGNNILGIIFSNAHDEALSEVTDQRTMGSVPFGGRYRLIDFPLSGMVNCGISKVGVITKSNYQSLMDHLGTGKPWDLSRKTEGLFILPPFNRSHTGIYSNKIEALDGIMNFIKHSKEEYVVLCDCNVVASIDYKQVVEYHCEKGADITVVTAYGKPPAGIEFNLCYDLAGDGRVKQASLRQNGEETEHSMNIFVMRKFLLERLVNDAKTRPEPHFQKDIIVQNIAKLKVYAYQYVGFQRTIDGLQSYFDANMALLEPKNRKALFSDEIYTKVKDTMPARYGLDSTIKNSLVADGCVIEGTVENCILFRNATVGKGAVVKNSIIMQDAYISDGASLNYTILDKETVVKPGKQLSGADSYPIYVGKKTIV